MPKSEAIKIQNGETVIELTGTDKETFELDRKEMQDNYLLLETEYKAKQDTRASAITKLAEIAGLTEEEIKAII